MFRKTLFIGVITLIALVVWEQDSVAKTWKNTKISADSIIAAIERGDSVLIDSSEIFGPLIKKGTRVIIKNSITIRNSTFHDTVLFEDCLFMNPVTFVADTFDRAVIFSPTPINIGAPDGLWIALLEELRIGQRQDLPLPGWPVFMELADFSHSTFREYVTFEFANFNRDADFSSTIFEEDAYFSSATFGGDADFSSAIFEEDAYFSIATFGDSVKFSFTAFGTYTDLSFATFNGLVDLSPVEFRNTRIYWKQLKGHLVYNRTANYKLMKYWEEERQLEDADGVYLFLKDQERTRTSPWVRYPEYWFIQLTCGYGVKPLNTLYLCALIIFIWALLYTKSNAIKEIEKEFGHRRRRRKYRTVRKGFRKRLYDALYFSVQTFIIGVVSDWYPADEFLINFWKIKRIKFRTLAMIEGALGWILLVLFVVTLTRKFIR